MVRERDKRAKLGPLYRIAETLLPQAVASKVVIDPGNGRVRHIEFKAYSDPGSTEHATGIARGRVFVLAANAVEMCIRDRATDTTLINVGLAKTAKPGAILALRVLRLPEFSMASGVLFPFAAGKEQRLVREWRNKQGLERYAHFFKLSRKEGIQIVFE